MWRGELCPPLPGASPGEAGNTAGSVTACSQLAAWIVCLSLSLHLPLSLSITGAANTPLYVYSPVGLFPCPLGPNTKFVVAEEICSKFRFLGKFIAKAVMDSRMVGVGQLWYPLVHSS